MKLNLLLALSLLALSWSLPAQALDTGMFRISADFDPLRFGGTKLESDVVTAELESKTLAVGTSYPSVGLGLGYTLTPHFVLGLRFGVGFEREKPESGSDTKTFDFTLVPNLTVALSGETLVPFLHAGPLVEAYFQDQGATELDGVVGGFELAAGVFVFASKQVSIDLSAYFQAAWGGADFEVAGLNRSAEIDVRFLRGGLRAGVSFWK